MEAAPPKTPDYLVCLGITTTCDESHANPAMPPLVPRDRAEIAELSFVVVATAQAKDVVPLAPQMLHWSQLLVRPAFTPWTPFCARVSGFPMDAVVQAKHTLASALAELDAFVQTYFVSQNRSFAFVTHGDHDLRCHLVREAKEKSIVLPAYFSRFFDIASQVRIAAEAMAYHHDEFAAPGTVVPASTSSASSSVVPIIPHNMSLVALCHQVGLQHEGRLNCGIDNALMLAKITIATLNAAATWVPMGGVAAAAGSVVKKEVPFTVPVDLGAALAEFFRVECKVVFVTGISFNTTVT
ncbi:hypothetical protein HDU98_004911, partial [Podochytrium sp. JEL0797]